MAPRATAAPFLLDRQNLDALTTQQGPDFRDEFIPNFMAFVIFVVHQFARLGK